MNRLVPSRFEITLTLLELDDWGEPVNEHRQPELVLYGLTAARDWLEQLPAQALKAERKLGGDSDGNDPEIRASLSGTVGPA
jgi:hypothetical protein